MRTDYQREKESESAFNARIDAEDIECLVISCPLPICSAQAGEMCRTEAGDKRLRHARRLWQVRRENG